MFESVALQQVDRTFVFWRGRRYSYFSGCDYFRLASHPEVLAALHAAANEAGLNVAASRLTSGEHALYRRLEAGLAKFFAAEDALVVSSGYLGGIVAAQGLAGEFSHVLLDDRAHPALADAARFMDCPVLRFPNLDPVGLAAVLKRCGPGVKPLLITDGMFSRSGQPAPLSRYLEVLPKDAWLLVDDAHGAGVLGRTGKGTLEYENVSRNRVVQTVTLSKAFGAFGGAVLGNRWLRKRIVDRAHAFAGSTPIPLPVANAALKAIELMKRNGAAMRKRLFANASIVKEAAERAGVVLPEAPGPIVSILPANAADAARFKKLLASHKIYPPFVHYPNGPTGGYFRFVISSEHTGSQLKQLVECLRQWQGTEESRWGDEATTKEGGALQSSRRPEAKVS